MSAMLKKTISVSLPEADELTQLSTFTDVVADTGDFESMKKFTPRDATTNPSLLLKAAIQPEYVGLVDEAIKYALSKSTDNDERLNIAMDKVAVNFGVEITKIVPGWVSTEVDARLSFNTEATVAKARSLIAMYKEMGVDKSRILIKIAATYEGIRAAEILERDDGICCNLTLLFSLVQAVACADANITLISPFVGRIMDWHKAKAVNAGNPAPVYVGTNDPGVASVMRIYNYFKIFNAKTIIMGASFRNKDEVLTLAGCDKLTISPALLEEMSHSFGIVHRLLSKERCIEAAAAGPPLERIPTDEANFRWQLNQDAMATEKLSEGIRAFAADIVKLENIMKAKMFPGTA